MRVIEKRLAHSKFVSLLIFVALALSSSCRAQEENIKISQTLTTQNSSLAGKYVLDSRQINQVDVQCAPKWPYPNNTEGRNSSLV